MQAAAMIIEHKRKGEKNVPVITLEGGKLTAEQKKELVHLFTETASAVTKVPKQFFSVLIREMDDENLGFGGETVKEMKERMAKQA